MAFPNVSDILATTIESRTRQIQDNVTENNAILKKLSMKGKIKTFSGGTKIYQEISVAENTNAGWYSGYDILPTNPADVISAAEYAIKQAACPVIMSGLEMLQNAGKEQLIDLMDNRLSVAEASMANLISEALYSDGTASGGKQLEGLALALPIVNSTGTYGLIARAAWAFWRHAVVDVTGTTALIANLNTLWAALIRGMDRPDLVMVDNVVWSAYQTALQLLQRFSDPKVGDLGFVSLKFMDADLVLDGGIGGNMPVGTAYMLNSKYLHYRPHAGRNMVPLSPNKRYSTNQDAEIQILAFAGNLTSSGNRFHGRADFN